MNTFFTFIVVVVASQSECFKWPCHFLFSVNTMAHEYYVKLSVHIKNRLPCIRIDFDMNSNSFKMLDLCWCVDVTHFQLWPRRYRMDVTRVLIALHSLLIVRRWHSRGLYVHDNNSHLLVIRKKRVSLPNCIMYILLFTLATVFGKDLVPLYRVHVSDSIISVEYWWFPSLCYPTTFIDVICSFQIGVFH